MNLEQHAWRMIKDIICKNMFIKKTTIIKMCFIALLVAIFCYYAGSECAKYDLNHSSTK